MLRVGNGSGAPKHDADRVALRLRPLRPLGKLAEIVELDGIDRAQRKVPLHQRFDAGRRFEPGGLRAQQRNRVTLAADLVADFGDALGLQGESNLIL